MSVKREDNIMGESYEVEHGSFTPLVMTLVVWEGKQVNFTPVYQSQRQKNVKSDAV